MSVDMYFTVDVYVGGKWRNDDSIIAIPESGIHDALSIPLPLVSSITLETGHLCNAYHIHQWLKDTAIDDSGEQKHYMTESILQQLKEVCEEVLQSRELADTLLPMPYGWSYGEWYFQTLQEAIDIVNRTLKVADEYGCDIYYEAS
jgi:hypothetical protein